MTVTSVPSNDREIFITTREFSIPTNATGEPTIFSAAVDQFTCRISPSLRRIREFSVISARRTAPVPKTRVSPVITVEAFFPSCTWRGMIYGTEVTRIGQVLINWDYASPVMRGLPVTRVVYCTSTIKVWCKGFFRDGMPESSRTSRTSLNDWPFGGRKLKTAPHFHEDNFVEKEIINVLWLMDDFRTDYRQSSDRTSFPHSFNITFKPLTTIKIHTGKMIYCKKNAIETV